MQNSNIVVQVKKLNSSVAKGVEQKLQENGGYCPCKLEHSNENKCMCKEFRDIVNSIKNQGTGITVTCHCGLYEVTSELEEVSV